MDAVHQGGVRRADVLTRRRRPAVVDERGTCRGRVGAAGAACEQDEGGAAVSGSRRLLLLAADVEAMQTDGQLRAPALAAAMPQNLQVAHGPAKVISGQVCRLGTDQSRQDRAWYRSDEPGSVVTDVNASAASSSTKRTARRPPQRPDANREAARVPSEPVTDCITSRSGDVLPRLCEGSAKEREVNTSPSALSSRPSTPDP